MSENNNRQGLDPDSTYTADVKHSDGVLVGAGIQLNLFHRDESSALRLTRLGFIVALIVALLGASSVFAAAIALTSKNESLGPPEVLLEPRDQQGTNPFMPTPPTVYRPDVIEPVADLPAISGSAAAEPYSGDLPGLYSAPRDRVLTDRDDMIAFYAAHPDTANAAAGALGSDASFAWSRGGRIEGSNLVDYLKELTPVLLRIDVRVTNYTLVNGYPVAQQSILQAGTALLVDQHGVPRFRSLSGSPLTLPSALPHAPTYSGTPWQGFDAKRVGAVSASTAVLVRITLVDTETGRPFDRPVGTTGGGDVDHVNWPSTTTPPTTTTTPTSRAATVVPTTSLPTAKAQAGPLDLSGLWVLESSSASSAPFSAVGTMRRTPAGFLWHQEEVVNGITGFRDCTLPDKLGETVTVNCRISGAYEGQTYGADWSCIGSLVTIQWGPVTKVRFDGTSTPTTLSYPQFSMTIRPQ